MLLYCENNQLTSLPILNKKLQTLCCSYNKLSSLPILNENLRLIYCDNNQLTSLPMLNEKLEVLNCFCNPIYDIINADSNSDSDSDSLQVIRERVNILNNFRNLYYALKFKKTFRKLLWEKIREPKIMDKYHPNNLCKMLNEETDLDMVLSNW